MSVFVYSPDLPTITEYPFDDRDAVVEHYRMAFTRGYIIVERIHLTDEGIEDPDAETHETVIVNFGAVKTVTITEDLRTAPDEIQCLGIGRATLPST